jgi:hypothetical protein
MLHWTRGKDEREQEERLLQNLRQFEDELTMYPLNDAIKMRKEVEAACNRHGIPWETRDLKKLQVSTWNQYNDSVLPLF